MFERGKKVKSDKSTPDILDIETEEPESSNWKPSPTVKAPASTGRRDVAVIGRSIRIDGDLRGEEDLLIEGDVTGTVQLRNNTLTIGSEGKISANVYAKSVTVDGLMQGDIFASERVCIRKSAQVNGNVTAPRVSLEDGAKFKGSIEMDPAEVEKALSRQTGATKGPTAIDTKTKNTAKSNIDTRVSKTGAGPDIGGSKNETLG